MLEIATLLRLVGGLGSEGLFVFCGVFFCLFYFFFLSKFKSLKCTVSLRLLCSWTEAKHRFVCRARVRPSGWSWNKGCMDQTMGCCRFSFPPSENRARRKRFRFCLRGNPQGLYASPPFSMTVRAGIGFRSVREFGCLLKEATGQSHSRKGQAGPREQAVHSGTRTASPSGEALTPLNNGEMLMCELARGG